MMPNDYWKRRPASERLVLGTAVHPYSSSKTQGIGRRARELYKFFSDFWQFTPHPMAQMALVVGWAVIVATINDDRVAEAGVTLDGVAGGPIKTILAFLIVFRTNQSYNRWWEGRILWGKMHWSCVELTQEAAVWIDDRHLALRVMNMAITFAYTVKQILRKDVLHADDLEGIIDPAEVEAMNGMSVMVMPYYCTDVIRQCTKKGLGDSPQKHGAQSVARGIDIPVSMLAQQFADMARVKTTPQPDVFRVILHMFTMVYLLLLPVITYDALGLWVVAEVFLTTFLMLGLQLAANNLEDPFGHDLSDLQLDQYVTCIASQCREAFYVGNKGGNDLTLGPPGTKADSANAGSSGRCGGGGGRGVGPIGTNKGYSAFKEEAEAVAAEGKEAPQVKELRAPVKSRNAGAAVGGR